MRALDPWDVRQLATAFGFAALSATIAWLLTAVSDEGGISMAVRAIRALPAAPLCAAIGTWITYGRARRRGELLALETVGVRPQRSAAPSVIGGCLVPVLAALAIALSPRIDVTAFFPAVPHADDIRFERGAFVDARRGVRYEPDGTFVRVGEARAPSSSLPRGAHGAAALAIALTGIALPLLVAAPRSRRGAMAHALGIGVATGGMLVGFHAVAATLAPAYLAAIPAFALLAYGARAYAK